MLCPHLRNLAEPTEAVGPGTSQKSGCENLGEHRPIRREVDDELRHAIRRGIPIDSQQVSWNLNVAVHGPHRTVARS